MNAVTLHLHTQPYWGTVFSSDIQAPPLKVEGTWHTSIKQLVTQEPQFKTLR